MEYQNFGNMMVVRLDKGDKIAESLLKAVKTERLASASITGIVLPGPVPGRRGAPRGRRPAAGGGRSLRGK